MPKGQMAGPKGCQLEVGAQRALRLLYLIKQIMHGLMWRGKWWLLNFVWKLLGWVGSAIKDFLSFLNLSKVFHIVLASLLFVSVLASSLCVSPTFSPDTTTLTLRQFIYNEYSHFWVDFLNKFFIKHWRNRRVQSISQQWTLGGRGKVHQRGKGEPRPLRINIAHEFSRGDFRTLTDLFSRWFHFILVRFPNPLASGTKWVGEPD